VLLSITESAKLLELDIIVELEKILGEPPVCRNITVLSEPIRSFFTKSVNPAIAFPV